MALPAPLALLEAFYGLEPISFHSSYIYYCDIIKQLSVFNIVLKSGVKCVGSSPHVKIFKLASF